MRNNILVASALAATAIMFVAGCSSNQSIKTPTARPLSPAVNRRWMMTPASSHTKMPKPAAWSRLTATR
ncbi:lipoprotein [Klebsiella pneumoniae]|uniref:Lipoprotein n=1 Tax=Klebsiella pneumoniae TaxID=573 RepID=A0A378FX87_KLEPN|nr:lipoprotein [Klebsiella pneumoniae]